MNHDKSLSTARFGTVSIQNPINPHPAGHADRSNTSTIYTWRPPAHLRDQLPADFKIAFECSDSAEEGRVFVPVGGGPAYVHWAFLAGLEILRSVQDLSIDEYHSYLAMRFLFNRVRQMHEHWDRRFEAARDLFVRQRGRGGEIERSLLPADVGLDATDDGRPWSIQQLTVRGREAARSRGIANPTNRQAIHYGLAAAARMRPLQVSDRETPALLKLALFDTTNWTVRPAKELIELVNDRLLRAVHQHLDDSREKFHAWFMPGKGNLSKTLAGGKRSPGGQLQIADVNHVLLDQGWESYQYMTNCIHAFAHSFRNALTEPLNPAELSLFQHFYEPQACYGGFPLVLVLERGSFLNSIVRQLCLAPCDRDLIGTLHRLLSWYAEMAENRRTADRRFKQKATHKHLPTLEVTGLDTALNLMAGRKEGSEPGSTNKTNKQGKRGMRAFNELVAALVKLKRLKCPSCEGNWKGKIVGSSSVNKDIFVKIVCQCRHSKFTVSTTKQELKRAAKR